MNMVAGPPVYEYSKGEDSSLLEGLQPNDLVVGEVLFTEFGNIYENGYMEGSVEEVAAGTFLLFKCIGTRYNGFPPGKYRDDYYDVERTIKALAEDPHASECLAETERILVLVEHFLQHFDPGIGQAEQYEYIYGLYSGVVDPYLVRVGHGETDVQSVIREMEFALHPRMVLAHSHRNTSRKKVVALML